MLLTWDKFDRWLCKCWLPFGFAVFLSGFFWAQDSQTYKVMVSYCLLLPALLSTVHLRRWRHSIAQAPALWLTATYLAYMSIAAIVLTGSVGTEFSKWSLYVLLFLAAIGLRMHISQRSLALLLLACATIAALAGLYAIGRDCNSGALWHPKYRLKGYATLYNELRSGVLFGSFSIIAAWCALNRDISLWQRYVGAVVAIIGLATTLLTGSRAPFLALAVTGIWTAFSARRWLHVGLIIAGVCLVLAVFWGPLSDRGVSLRPEIWQYAWRQSLENPWFGVGLSRAPIEVMTSLGVKYNTHNIFLAVMYQGGIIGLLFFLAVIATTIAMGWSVRKVSAFGALAAMLQLYSVIALQFDGPRLITRPSDAWVWLWLPIALQIYAHRMAYCESAPQPTTGETRCLGQHAA